MDIDSAPPSQPPPNLHWTVYGEHSPANYRASVSGVPSTMMRAGIKRSRTASPERATKRPALLTQTHSHSASHSPLAMPSGLATVGAQANDAFPGGAQQQQHGFPAEPMRRDGSADFLRKTQRLGLRTPADAQGGANTPVEGQKDDTVDPLAGWDVGMAVDVEMCDDMSRPVLPLRRSSARSASFQSPLSSRPSSPHTHGFANLPHSHPLNRPHPAAFQQHLALSPRNTAGPFPAPAAVPDASFGAPAPFEAKPTPALIDETPRGRRSPSPIMFSPPVSPQMNRQATNASASSAGSKDSTPAAHNGFGSATTSSPGMRFSLGPRADCEKCRMKVPGHYNHLLE